ncbi:hypothetical protein LguiA_009365 [Lonicera macranthoides]
MAIPLTHHISLAHFWQTLCSQGKGSGGGRNLTRKVAILNSFKIPIFLEVSAVKRGVCRLDSLTVNFLVRLRDLIILAPFFDE